MLITRRCNSRKVLDIHNTLTSTHFPRRDFFTLETPAKSFYKGRNYPPFKNFQDQKYENCDYGALLITRRCNRRNVQDNDNNLTPTHFLRRDFFALRHPQSHSRKVETMHLLRIFKIKRMKMRLWRIAYYETIQ